MNSYSILVVNEHLDYLLEEAAARRATTANNPGLLKRIASAASSVKAAIEAPADYSKSILPTLNDYPYRS
jgi:hypothetical protein